MARNIHEHGYRFFHPQIDWGGQTSGEVECELPLYAYGAASLYALFGEWTGWGRLLSVLASLATALF